MHQAITNFYLIIAWLKKINYNAKNVLIINNDMITEISDAALLMNAGIEITSFLMSWDTSYIRYSVILRELER